MAINESIPLVFPSESQLLFPIRGCPEAACEVKSRTISSSYIPGPWTFVTKLGGNNDRTLLGQSSGQLPELRDTQGYRPSLTALDSSARGPDTLGSTHHSLPWRGKASPLGTYKHLDGDRDSTVQRGVASILGHDHQINQPIGHLFIIQGTAHTDH